MALVLSFTKVNLEEYAKVCAPSYCDRSQSKKLAGVLSFAKVNLADGYNDHCDPAGARLKPPAGILSNRVVQDRLTGRSQGKEGNTVRNV